jgi:hypothetical protein
MQRKFLTVSLILYVLALLTQPCQDLQDAFFQVKAKTTVAAVSSSIPSDGEPVPETCSPFCVCGCCSLSVVHQGLTSFAMIESFTVTETGLLPAYQSPSNGFYVDSIWQPPKV